MNVLLINPRIGTFGSDGLFPPIGLASLAANAGPHHVAIWDEGVEPHRYPDWGKWDIVGISVVTPGLDRARELARLARCSDRRPRVVFGGPHVSARPQDDYPEVDHIITGEAERSLEAFLSDPSSAPRRIDSARVDRLDTLARPAYDLLPWRLYRGQPVLGNKLPIGVVNTSRGCPFECGFCYKGIFGREYRWLSAGRVVDEVLRWHRMGVAEWTVTDDAFATRPDRVKAICLGLMSEGLTKIPWTCSNGIRVETDAETLIWMRQAGCYRVSLGIESGSQAVLDAIGKRTTLDSIRAGVQRCRSAGLRTMGFFILGLPWDTCETMRQTIDFACSLPLDFAQFSTAMPYPGTAIERLVARDGLLINGDKLNIYGSGGVAFDMPGRFRASDVNAATRSAYWEFYGRRAHRFDTWAMAWRKWRHN